MNKRGLTLIELLIYLAISVLLVTLLCSLMISLFTSAQQRAKANDTALTLSVALMTIARDIKSHSSARIKECGLHYCIITRDGKDLGWIYKKGKLMRYTGHYNVLTKKWAQVGSSQLARPVHEVLFTYHWQGALLKGISCRLSTHHLTLQLYTGVA